MLYTGTKVPNSCLPPTLGRGATPELTEPLVTEHVGGGAAATVPEWLVGGRARTK